MAAILQVPATDLAAQWREIADEVEPVVLARLRSGDYLGAESVEAFEHEFAAYVGGGVHAVACSSGTDAVELMVRATTPEGASVGVPNETFVATLAAVERSGRGVVGQSLGYEHSSIAVWLYGSTAGADAIARECAERGVQLLEDASQAHGNKRAGTIGVAAAWSLYPSKNLGAAGQAGVVTFKDSVAAAKARRIREHGYDRATDRHWGRGFNLRMDGIQADVLRAKLKRLDAWVERKRQIAKAYIDGLKSLTVEPAPLTLPKWEKTHAWHQFVVRVNAGEYTRAGVPYTYWDGNNNERTSTHTRMMPVDRDYLLGYLRSQGIGAMVHYRTTADGRETEWSRSVLSLPCHAHMSDEHVAYVIEHVKKAVRG